MHPLLLLVSGTSFTISCLLYYAVLRFDKAVITTKRDIAFIVSQVLICGFCLSLLFFYPSIYFCAAAVLAISFVMVTDGPTDFAAFIIGIGFGISAFFMVPLIALIVYFKLDEIKK